MKKKFVLIIVCVMLCLAIFSGCEPAEPFVKESKEIAEIHLIYYNNPDVKKLYYRAPRRIPFNFDKMTVIGTMADDKKVEFSEKFSCLPTFIENAEGTYDSPQGHSLMIVLNNGDFIVLSVLEVEYVAKFASDGRLLRYYGVTILRTTRDINPYFGTQLPDNY